MKFSRLLSLALVSALSVGNAQMAKKPLTQADWDRWRSITNPTLSSDGKWASYTLTPQVGDGEFVVRSTTGATEIRIPVGYIGRPNNTPGGLRGAGGAAGGGGGAAVGGRGQFSPDSRFAIVTVGAPKSVVDSVARAQAANRGRGAGRGATGGAAGQATTPAPANPATRAQIAVINLADNSQVMIDGRAPRFAQESGKWMLYTPAGDSVAAGGDAGAAQGGGRGGRGGGGGGAGAPAAAGGRRTYGSNLVLRNMSTGTEEKMSDILAATFDDSAKVLVYTVASRDTTKDGIFVRDMNTGAVKTVLTGKGNYRGFTFDRTQTKFAFTSDRDEFGKDKARSAVYLGDLKTGTATAVITPAQWPTDYRLPDNGGTLAFTRAGNAITFQLAPPPEDTIPASARPSSTCGTTRTRRSSRRRSCASPRIATAPTRRCTTSPRRR
jgi:hypothetical protein